MKPPIAWSPQEAMQVEQFVRENPQEPDSQRMMADLAEYKIHQDRRSTYDKSDHFKPDKMPAALGLRTLLPEKLGGLSVAHFEPSLADFRAMVSDQSHVGGGTGLKPNSPEEDAAYRDFKDEAWTRAVTSARASGRPVVRRGISREKQEADEAAGAANEKLSQDERYVKPALGSVLSVGRGLVPGMVDAYKGIVPEKDAKFMDEAEAATPEAARVIGETLGAIRSPIMNKLVGAFGEGESVLGGVARGAAGGAAASVGANAMGNVGKGIEDAFRKPEEKGALRRIKETGVDTLLETPTAALTGGALGAPFGLLRGFGGALRNEATTEGRALRAAEDAGVTTSVTAPGGLKAPPTLQVTGLPPNVHPTDNAIAKARPAVAKGAAKTINDVVAPIEAENAAYYTAADKLGAKANMGPMTRSLVNLIKGRSFESTEGGELPLMSNRQLRQELHKTAEVKLVPLHEARDLERAGAVAVPLDEAISTGMVEPGMQPTRGAGATMPPGADDAAADAFLRRAQEVGLDAARAENIGPHVAGRPSIPAPGPDLGGQGLAAGSDRATIIPPGGITPRQFRAPPPVGTPGPPRGPDPSAYAVVFVPRELTAKQADEVINGVDRAAGISEAEGAGRSDPAFKELPRAARAVRDQLPAVPGITDRYPDATITGPDGKPLKLTGRSAMAHAHSQKLAELKLQTKRAGLSSDRFDPSDVLEQEKAGQALYGVGPGVGETDRTRAVLDFARNEPGGERAVKDVIASRILRGGPLSPKSHQPMHGSAVDPSLAASAWQRFQYHLDPIAKALGKGAPAAGILGAEAVDPVTQALLDLAARTQQEHKVQQP